MSSKETVKAIIEVLKDKTQDINHVNDEVISSLNEQITKIIESMGYVKQEKYEGLLQEIKHMEKRRINFYIVVYLMMVGCQYFLYHMK